MWVILSQLQHCSAYSFQRYHVHKLGLHTASCVRTPCPPHPSTIKPLHSTKDFLSNLISYHKTSEIVNVSYFIRIQIKSGNFGHVPQESDIESVDIVVSQIDTA